MRIVNKFLHIFIITCYLLLATCYLLPIAHAQDVNIGVPTTYEIKDAKAVDGDILIYTSSGIVRANTSFSSEIFGVLQNSAILSFKQAGSNGKTVLRSGDATVNVTDLNGAIKSGNYVTSSEIPGFGQKATESGYVLGIALADFKPEGKTTFQGQEVSTGTIPVAIRIEYSEITNTKSLFRLLDYANVIAFRTAQNPDRASQLIKFLTASAVAIGTVLLSLGIFARSITKSIEAIGRNPLAKTSIEVSIMINAALTIVTILLGMGAAYLILRA